MKISTIAIAMGIVMAFSMGSATAKCKKVKGKIESQVVVGLFSDGSECTSPLGFCTEGKFSGGAKGYFTFTPQTLTPFSMIDDRPSVPLDVSATTGNIMLTTKKLCKIDATGADGILVFEDTSAFAVDDFLLLLGEFASIQTAVGGTGRCANATGRIRAHGPFVAGCPRGKCDYEGEICGLP